jgi:hypothetical protein
MESKLEICGNCKHFFQTGMAISMSTGNSGYCLLIQNNKKTEVRNESGIRKSKREAIMKKSDNCEKFEKSIIK